MDPTRLKHVHQLAKLLYSRHSMLYEEIGYRYNLKQEYAMHVYQY